jgi:hypothetical protein
VRLDSQSASGILKGLYQPATSIHPINGRDLYVSRGWDLDDAKLADTVRLALGDADFSSSATRRINHRG